MYVAGQSLRLYREAGHKGTKVVVGHTGERGLLGRPPRSLGAHAHTDEEECPVRPS